MFRVRRVTLEPGERNRAPEIRETLRTPFGRARLGAGHGRDPPTYRMPTTLCVCTLSRHFGCAMQYSIAFRVFSATSP